ncbi:hypothetical protein [Halolamina salifodinae]|uniref:Uncharacterized protein n=1 Tax=Halolamina salifodinae TaxID=1202767 RepID=A0A8T4GWZ8_9EURY|nr:hypothetical protein [Halolamina salifodinae]MBP1986583.1 hypothetical protein [Halolamina salifodinae]
MDDDAESEIAESVTISALIAVVATALIYVELWGGSVPALPGASTLALTVAIGVAAGGTFYYTGTHETRLEDVPPLAVFLVLAVVVYVLFPEGLPVAAELAIIVGVWTDTALRAAAKYVF